MLDSSDIAEIGSPPIISINAILGNVSGIESAEDSRLVKLVAERLGIGRNPVVLSKCVALGFSGGVGEFLLYCNAYAKTWTKHARIGMVQVYRCSGAGLVEEFEYKLDKVLAASCDAYTDCVAELVSPVSTIIMIRHIHVLNVASIDGTYNSAAIYSIDFGYREMVTSSKVFKPTTVHESTTALAISDVGRLVGQVCELGRKIVDKYSSDPPGIWIEPASSLVGTTISVRYGIPEIPAKLGVKQPIFLLVDCASRTVVNHGFDRLATLVRSIAMDARLVDLAALANKLSRL